MTIKHNITINQGSDYSEIFDLLHANNDVVDLTLYTGASQMRKTYSSSAAAATFTVTHNSAGGAVTIALSSAATNELEPGRYFYDIELRDSANSVSRILEGEATVTAGMTRI